MLTNKQLLCKRFFDVSLFILVAPFAIFPLFLLLVIASISVRGNGLFKQKRIGQFGTPFYVYKIRSLRGENHTDIVDIKRNETSIGRWLRHTKLDELPQLYNVLIGNMSWVGPRPDVPGYADKLQGADRVVLQLKPGITGPATLKYKNEDELLLKQEHPLQYNDTVIWPDKVKINKKYIQDWSIRTDIKYIFQSVF